MEGNKSAQKFDPNIIRRKVFLVEKFINFLIIIRFYITELPLWAWAGFLIILYALKMKRQGNIPTSIFTILAILCSIFGEYFKINFAFLAAPLLSGISHFFSYKVFWFPKIQGPVGLRQEVLQQDTYMVQLYPIKKNENVKKKVIPWNYKLQLKRMLEHEQQKGPIYRALIKFFCSYINRYKIIFAEGDEQPTNKAIVYSHGRTGTPLMNSQILQRMVTMESQKLSVFAVQHIEKHSTGIQEVPRIKKFREIEVQARAARMYDAVEHCKGKKHIILMGHSYGGATTVQTYHCLPPELKKKVSHIILLDPWLFPLTQSKLTQQIQCPVLVLANEYFIQNERVYNDNKEFLNSHKKHKVIYMVWKNADHLHQTDLCFILGNIMGKVKHPELSIEMLNKNTKAIEMFLNDGKLTEEKMYEVFKDDLLPKGYKPEKWNNYLTL